MRQPIKILIWPALLLSLLPLLYFLYKPGLTAGLNFDDAPNLDGLKGLDRGDFEQILKFVFGGLEHGGLGRPLAYLSFLFQAPYWPSHPDAFLYTNILIHLINGLLVAWIALRLHRLNPTLAASGEGLAVCLAGIWLVQPLLASASLMVVQRMTTLAATFMLSGIVVYLMGREHLGLGNPRGWLVMTGGAGIATILAVFTKENGALLPLYIWVLEITLLKDYSPSPTVKQWQKLLALPGIILLVYWMTRWSSLALAMNSRAFNIYERILTEFRVLAEYIFLVFVPVRNWLGPFHDDYVISHSLLAPPATLFCVLGWVTLIFFAIIKRQRFPLLAFAVGWFLVGHLLESTVFNLELYFEHRNYLPSVGPLAALCILFCRLPSKQRNLGAAALSLYFGLQAFVLHEQTTVWGTPILAAKLWIEKHPKSERARQFMATQYLRTNDENSALIIMRDGYRQNRNATGLALQYLAWICYRGNNVNLAIKEILPILQNGDKSYAGIEPLVRMSTQLQGKPCPGLDLKTMHLLLDTLLANPKVKADPSYLTELHQLKAGLYLKTRELDPVIRNLETAFDEEPNIDVAMLIIGYLSSAGLNDVALEKITAFRSHTPANPIINRGWNHRLDEAEADIVSQLQSKPSKY